jgi:hypothetical protein
MRAGDKFTDQRVRYIKQALMRGADPRAIARIERVSANTIRRIRDGETYNHVVVEGEDSMRRPLDIQGYEPLGVQARNENGLAMPVPEVDAGLAEMLGAKMMERQAANAGLPRAPEAQVEETAEQRAKRLLGVG